MLIALALILAVNLHDLVAHVAMFDYRMPLMEFDLQLAPVVFAVLVVQALGTVLSFLRIHFGFLFLILFSKDMVYLRGTLHISKLENAVNAGEANLKGKEMIQKVVYEWSNNDLNFHDEAAAKQVLEDLEPHPRALKELQICHYKGTEFPRWMGLLTNLVSIHLNNCNRSKVLDLGVLPKLEEFRLKNLLELEDWNGTFKSLKKLKIANCPNLKRCVNYSEGLDFLKIKRCESLVSLTINYLVRPKNITLVDNPVLQSWFVRSSHLLGLSSGLLILNELIIINCPELHALPNCFNLEKLETGGCNSVIKMLERGSLKQSVQAKELRHLALDTDEIEVSL